MRRFLLALAALLLAAPGLARAQSDEQIVVDRATLTVQEMMTRADRRTRATCCVGPVR